MNENCKTQGEHSQMILSISKSTTVDLQGLGEKVCLVRMKLII